MMLPEDLFRDLHSQSPALVLDYVRAHLMADSPHSPAQQQWWAGIAQAAALESFPSAGGVNLGWALVAVTIYRHLGEGEARQQMMWFKARVIKACGDQEPLAVATVRELMDWFFTRLPLSLAEAHQLLPEQGSGADMLLRRRAGQANDDALSSLQTLKSRLRVIDLLREHPKIANHAELQQWLALIPRLP